MSSTRDGKDDVRYVRELGHGVCHASKCMQSTIIGDDLGMGKVYSSPMGRPRPCLGYLVVDLKLKVNEIHPLRLTHSYLQCCQPPELFVGNRCYLLLSPVPGFCTKLDVMLWRDLQTVISRYDWAVHHSQYKRTRRTTSPREGVDTLCSGIESHPSCQCGSQVSGHDDYSMSYSYTASRKK